MNKLCFYCNKPNADTVVTSVHNTKIRVHKKCLPALKSLVQIQIHEVTS